MKLGIEGRWALVCAASKGLGEGCAKALVMEGVNVVITARGAGTLGATANELRALNPDVQVLPVTGDITRPEDRAAALAAAPQIDILINNASGPPPGDFRNWSRDDWIKTVDANMLTPIDLTKSIIDGMGSYASSTSRPPPLKRRLTRAVYPTALALGSPVLWPVWHGNRKWLAKEVMINGLLPEPFNTERLQTMIANWAKRDGKTYDELAAVRAKTVPARRFGTTDEFGATCAFFRRTHAATLRSKTC